MSFIDTLSHLLLASPVFCLIVWLLRNKIPNLKARILWSLGGTMLAYPICLYGLIMGYFAYLDYVQPVKFNQAKWLSDRSERHPMKKDLVKSKSLEGRDKQQVYEFLGAPDYGSDTSKNVWLYDMGSSTAGFGICIHFLRLKFEGDSLSEIILEEGFD